MGLRIPTRVESTGAQFTHRWTSADKRRHVVFAATWFRSPRSLREECRDEVSAMLYHEDPNMVALGSILVSHPRLLWVIAWATLAVDFLRALVPAVKFETGWRCPGCDGIHFERPGVPESIVRVRSVKWLRLAVVWFREEGA